METRHMTIRMPVDIYEAIEKAADREDRSKGNIVVMALRKALKVKKS